MKYGHVQKRYLLLLVMLGLVTGCGKETLAKKSTDENEEVKKDYTAEDSRDTEIIEYRNDGAMTAGVTYDEDGRIAKITEYTGSGWKDCETIFDESGNEIKKTTYGEDGSIESVQEYDSSENEGKKESDEEKYTYEYDGAGKKQKATKYDENDKVEKVLEYNSDENIVKITWFYYDDETGKLRTEFEQDYVKKREKRTSFFENGEVSMEQEYKLVFSVFGGIWGWRNYYESLGWTRYNENGQIEKEATYGPDERRVKYYNESRVITYDLLEKKELDAGGNIMHSTDSDDEWLFRQEDNNIRSIYYNADGSISYTEEYDSDGNIIMNTR